MPQECFITLPSKHGVSETIDRLSAIAQSKGLRIFARIDHAKGAEEVGLPLRPTQLLLFGHPKGGTPLMQDRQTAGLDLPLKALAWEDEKGQVWLSYYTGSMIAARHGLSEASKAAVEAIDKGMALLCGMAAGEEYHSHVGADVKGLALGQGAPPLPQPPWHLL